MGEVLDLDVVDFEGGGQAIADRDEVCEVLSRAELDAEPCRRAERDRADSRGFACYVTCRDDFPSEVKARP
ncbi:hypothetical protein ACQPX6_01830 [Actinomycetospora sp. CA-101289]|uniref:hypothetical protein n=1 Tax=Actinomycetospora sp. CA-101289 TaxID=3239893 RepID=UPI003D997062